MSVSECQAWIFRATATGFEPMGNRYPGGYRNNDRLVLDDLAWASELFRRLAPQLPAEHIDQEGVRWTLCGLNSRFRFCRYRAGQSFTRHQDGAWTSANGERSWLTCQLYLNDAAEFEGGATRFYAGRDEGAALVESVRPVPGMAIVFDHRDWHDGAPVPRGTKYVMRTDVMFRRAETQPAPGHRGYVWCALVRADGTLVTGSRDKTIVAWGKDGAVAQRQVGHTASVTALAEDARGRLWSGSRDATVRRWSGAESAVLGSHRGAVLSLASMGERGMLSAGADGLVSLWSLDGARLAEAGGFEGWVWSVARLDEGRAVAGSEDGMLRIWRVDGGLTTERVIPVGAPVLAVAVSRHGVIAAGTQTGEVLLLDATGTRRARLHTAPVTSLAFFADGRLASGGEDDCARVSRDLNVTFTLPHHGFVRTVAPLPDGGLVTGGYDGTVRTWPAVAVRRRAAPIRCLEVSAPTYLD